ncbi:hypothetical protein FP744_10006088 [Trichoderma asperellum]
MDPTNNRPLHPRRPYHPEPIPAPPVPNWMSRELEHPQVPQAYSLQNHAPRPLAYHSPGRAGTNFDSYQMSFTGGPLLPNPTPQAYTLPHPHGGGYFPHQGNWPPHSMPVPIPPNHAGMMNMSGGLRYEPPPILPAVGSGYPPQPPETPNYANLLRHRPATAAPDSAKSSTDGFYPTTSPVWVCWFACVFSCVTSANFLLTFACYTGYLPRAGGDGGAVTTSKIDLRDTDEGGGHNINDHRPELINHRMSQEPAAAVENIPARPIQIARSAEKNLPTKIALRFLQSVKIEDLAEKDRTCVICYNDFGVETPEGIKESPLRLPKCKHVFGDKCIKRWFEESDSCPYCRDKLPTHFHPGLEASRTNTFLTIMRARAQLPPGSSEEFYFRLMSSTMREEEEVGETPDVILLDPPLYRSGDSDSSTPDGEGTTSASSSSSASSSASTSPVRIPPRDVSRSTQWSSRATQQRGTQERGYRRQRVSRNNLSPLQALQSDGQTQSSATIPSANTREDESSQSPTDAGHQVAETSIAPATTAHNRNRPW